MFCFFSDTAEEDLWKTFEVCGEIVSVRIVRDGKTNIGKGFGYVNFKSNDSVALALQMENVHVKERELRISRCNASEKMRKKNKQKWKKNGTNVTNKQGLLRRKNGTKSEGTKNESGNKNVRPKKEGANNVGLKDTVKTSEFAGRKFTEKKKVT